MRRTEEKGQAIVISALALAVMMGFVALGVDMGLLRYERRLQQTAADAAAVAGASNLSFSSGGAVANAALNAAAANRFTDNLDGAQCSTSDAAGCIGVTVNNPPASGPHAGQSGYVEALVSAVHSTYFMRVLGVNSRVVVARAVATLSADHAGCIYTLGPPSASIEGLSISGNVTVNAPTCGILDNGNFNRNGKALDVNAYSFGVGGSAGSGGNVTCNGGGACPSTGMPAVGDPFAYLTPPAVGSAQPFNKNNIVPGTYNGIGFSGNGTYNFPAGTYVISGGSFSVNGNVSLTGSNVTFYLTNGASLDLGGAGTVQFTAPSTGTYAGVLFYQDPADTNGASIGGDSTSYYNGALYFPKANVTIYGNASGYSVGEIVAYAMDFHGNPTLNVSGSLPGGSGTKNAVLVE